MSETSTLESLPRLINEVELAQPINIFTAELYTWASQSGVPVKTLRQFVDLKKSYHDSNHPDRFKVAMDFEVALETISALEKAKHHDYAFYENIWRFKFSASLGSQSDDFAIMRSLQDYFGGILLNSRQEPYLLILPQPDGTYIQMGYESILQLTLNPLGEKRDKNEILQQSYIVSQRVIVDE